MLEKVTWIGIFLLGSISYVHAQRPTGLRFHFSSGLPLAGEQNATKGLLRKSQVCQIQDGRGKMYAYTSI